MRTRIIPWAWKLAAVAVSCHLLQTGCMRNFQREMEVLFAPMANPTLLYNSWVFNRLGPEFMVFFNRFW